jgi:hypothetical protein
VNTERGVDYLMAYDLSVAVGYWRRLSRVEQVFESGPEGHWLSIHQNVVTVLGQNILTALEDDGVAFCWRGCCCRLELMPVSPSDETCCAVCHALPPETS